MADFVPSPAQRKLCDFVLDHLELVRIGEICRLAGVPRRTYSFWSRDPGFCAWLASACTSARLVDGINLINLARAQAPRYFRYWKPLFDLTFSPRGFAVSVPVEQNQSLTAAHCPNSRVLRRPTPLQTLRLLQRFDRLAPKPRRAAA
ncbi:MAG: hypothetical protein ACRD1Y_07255 [Terriglobales bacterium]